MYPGLADLHLQRGVIPADRSAIGLAGALGLSTLLSSLVVFPDFPDLTYGAGAFNVTTFLGVLAVLIAVLLMASFVPVRRATRVEPMVALRND